MVLLSFNITESHQFYKNKFQIKDQDLLKILDENARSILRTLENHEVSATFFFAENLIIHFRELIVEIYKQRHEIAIFQQSSNFPMLQKAQEKISEFIGKTAKGIRVFDGGNFQNIKDLGFRYVSPIEKMKFTYLFRRLEKKTEVYTQDGVEVIPETISPYTQIPYNETVFQFVPMKYYQSMVLETLKNEEYVLVYLNMLQFTDFEKNNIKIPFYKKYNTGKKMEDRLEDFLNFINENDLATSLIKDYLF